MLTLAQSTEAAFCRIASLPKTGVGRGLCEDLATSQSILTTTYWLLILSYPTATPTSKSPLAIESLTCLIAIRPDEHNRLIASAGVVSGNPAAKLAARTS